MLAYKIDVFALSGNYSYEKNSDHVFSHFMRDNETTASIQNSNLTKRLPWIFYRRSFGEIYLT